MNMVTKPIISPDFMIEDIHKIREYNYEVTKNMSIEEKIAYEKLSDDIGKLVYIGKERNKQFSSRFKQTNPITPIYNSREELEEKAVYDE